MFSSLSKFTSISSISSILFININVDYFPIDIYTCSSKQISTSSDVSSTFGDVGTNVNHAPPTIDLYSRVRSLPTYVPDYHYFFTMLQLHETRSYKEASTHPY